MAKQSTLEYSNMLSIVLYRAPFRLIWFTGASREATQSKKKKNCWKVWVPVRTFFKLQSICQFYWMMWRRMDGDTWIFRFWISMKLRDGFLLRQFNLSAWFWSEINVKSQLGYSVGGTFIVQVWYLWFYEVLLRC